MRISVMGTGYVGLVTGTCLAELGNSVVCLDTNEDKIRKLNSSIIPIYEPGLDELIKRNSKEGRIIFSTDFSMIKDADIIFICVGTPQKGDGETDFSYVEKAALTIAEFIEGYKIIAMKSTVPVGSSCKIRDIIRKNMKSKADFDIVSNPEFLREGEAINDFMIPDRIIVGAENDKARKIMGGIYSGIARATRPVFFTSIKSAELIKYASNAMLASRISFMNEISRLCEAVGADIKEVAHGMGLDARIGPRFLHAGAGYGGSCFSKDIKALMKTMEQHGIEGKMLKSTEEINIEQRKIIVNKVEKALQGFDNKVIAVWGLSFKPKTDDMRDAPSIDIIKSLQQHGSKIRAFDPAAINNARQVLNDVEYCNDQYEALNGADALLVITEWNEFKNPDKEKMKHLMRSLNIIDGRNIYNPIEMKQAGFNYESIGRAS